MKLLMLTILGVLSLPFLGIGLYEAYLSRCQINDFVHTRGTVVGNSYITTSTDGNFSGAYLPQIEFSLPTGEKVRFTDKIGSLPPDYAIGEQLEVIYNPENSREALIGSWKRMWLAPALLIGIGLLLIIVGGYCCRKIS